jgi:hypothetical protein
MDAFPFWPKNHFTQHSWASKRFDKLAPVTFQDLRKLTHSLLNN